MKSGRCRMMMPDQLKAAKLVADHFSSIPDPLMSVVIRCVVGNLRKLEDGPEKTNLQSLCQERVQKLLDDKKPAAAVKLVLAADLTKAVNITELAVEVAEAQQFDVALRLCRSQKDPSTSIVSPVEPTETSSQ